MRLLLWTIGIVGLLAVLCQDTAAVDRAKSDFYQVAEVDGAWWFIAPDGNRFFSSGVNVVDVGGNRDNYDPKRPGYAAFLHYADNAAWAKVTSERLADWGFNTVGGWSAPEMTAGPLPYTAVLHLGRELGVPWVDVLNPHFAEQIAQLVDSKVSSKADDSNLIGWYTDNELAWFADSLFAFHIAQPAESATRKALVELLRKYYRGDYTRLQSDFKAVNASNFDELDGGGKLLLLPGGHGVEVADQFLRLIAAHFYKTAHDEIRRRDANHLILGDRYHGFCPDVVVEAAGPYVDVISTNFDQPDWTDGQLPAFYLQRLHQLSGRPVLVTEYYVAARDNRSGNKNTGKIFTTVSTQQERAQAVRIRLSTLASLPYVLGAHWFQLYDEPTFGRSDGEDYNFGLVDIDDRPYQELVDAFIDAHRQIPQLHAAAGTPTAKKSASEPLLVPMASVEPLAGIASWDQVRALVPCQETSSIGDLLVSWDHDCVYLAVGCSSFVDVSAYADQESAKRDELIWQFALGDSPLLTVNFGVGDVITVSDPAVEGRVHQHGLRYTALVAVPIKHFGQEHLAAGSRVRLVASLSDPRRGTKSSWIKLLECGPQIRDALSQQEPAAPKH